MVAFENTRPRALAGWRNSTGLWLIRIAAAATTIFAIALAQAQAQPATGPDSGAGNIRFYVGLSRRGLIDDNENDLRAYAVIQNHVNSIKRRLSIDAPTGELTFWNYTDWVKLRQLPITHYIVAHPKRKTPSEIEVEWHVGKFPANDFSANREPEYVGILKQRTIIAISGGDAAPKVAQLEGKARLDYDDWGESADTIVVRLNKIFPETRKEFGYFVDCFKNNVLDWKDVHSRMMVELSEELAKGVSALVPVLKFGSLEMASTMCNEPKYRDLDTYKYKEAYLYVGGSIWLYGKDNWVQPRITIRNGLLEDRKRFASPQIGGTRVDEPPELDQFCMKSREFSFTAIATLKTYIQAEGFHFRQPINLGDWKC